MTRVDVDNLVNNAVKNAIGLDHSIVSPQHQTTEEKLEAARINISDEYTLPPRAISIVSNNEALPFGSLGDFSLITGKAKSKKTFVISMILAAAESGVPLQDKFKSELPPDKRRIIWFDTEQSAYHVWKVLKRLATLAGVEVPKFIEVFCLRANTPKERAEMIEWELTVGNPDNNIGLVVIDGVRDLINDINSPEDATFIATKLLKWTANAGCHIVTVLHQNKGDTNARGHVGTELINKAETTISVARDEKDKSVSTVTAEYCRDREFEPFAIRITETGLPEIIEDYEFKGASEKRRSFDPYTLPPETHHNILTAVYKEGEPLRYRELQSRLQVEFMAYSQTLPDKAAQDLITYYHTKMGWLTLKGTPRTVAAKYSYLK
jgi:hypothetical protein